jgi:L-serine dehydratase
LRISGDGAAALRRKAFGAVTAMAAPSLALHGGGRRRISLDSVIATMRQTGADMQSKYRRRAWAGSR